MKVATIQTNIIWQDQAANLENFQNKILSSQDDVDLILFPETCSTGFTINSVRFAEDQNGATESFFIQSAIRKNCYVGGGWIEKNPDGHPFNTFSIASPDGKILGRYRKLHPFSFAGEDKNFSSGAKLVRLDVLGFCASLLICYDLRFPEIFRKTAGQTDLYIVIANWPEDRIDAWDTLLKARAIENLAFVLGVNRIGNAGVKNFISHNGHSSLYSPSGKNLFDISEDERILYAEISLDDLKIFRDRFPFLNDRRKELQ